MFRKFVVFSLVVAFCGMYLGCGEPKGDPPKAPESTESKTDANGNVIAPGVPVIGQSGDSAGDTDGAAEPLDDAGAPVEAPIDGDDTADPVTEPTGD